MTGRRLRRAEAPPPPPLLARCALALLLRPSDRRTVASDLGELYERRRARDGDVAAAAWLRRQWVQYPRHLLADRLRWGRRWRPASAVSTGTGRRGVRQMLGGAIADVRQSFRSLSRTPVLAATIVLTVGLGLGASTTVYSVVDATLVRPLPYPDPDRLVRIYTDAPPNRWPFSVVDYNALTEQQTSFESVAGYQNVTMTFAGDGAAENLAAKVVTWTYFSVMGVSPAIGRALVADDGVRGRPRAVVVSHGFWIRHLDGDRAALGRTIQLDGNDFTLVGVLPPTVGPFEDGREVFVASQWETPSRKGPFFITVLGRLRDGVAPDEARAELGAINRRLFPTWRASYQDERASWNLTDLKTFVVGDRAPTLLLALSAVGFVLLIASTNAASLLVARAAERRRELAVRSALGASRGRLLQHQLAESAVLAAAGAAVGLAVTLGGLRLVSAAAGDYLPRSGEIGLSGSVGWFLAAIAAASGLLFGLVPSLHAVGFRPIETLRSGGRSATDAAGPRRVRRGLVVAQVAVATPLLVAAGLLTLSLAALQRVDLGIDTRNVLSAAVYPPPASYPDPAGVAAFWDEAGARIASLPSVEAVGFADGRPPADVSMINNFDLEDDPTPPGLSQPVAPFIAVTPAFLAALGVTLQQGRTLDERDGHEDAPPVVVVDRAWADRLFPGQDVVGRRFREGGDTTGPWITVVGVVSSVKYAGLDQPDPGTVYIPMERDRRFRFLVVRTTVAPASLLPAVRQVVRELDPTLPLSNTATMDELVGNALEVPRTLSWLVGSFAAVALLLSVVGVYGVTAFFVQQHAKDIGIRIALGGEPARVAGLVVGQGLQVVVFGVALGLGGAFLLSRFLKSLLFEVGATDAATFVGSAAVLLAVAVVACLIPARRAAGIDPVTALREE